ncbi:MAG: FUSC family membrane protein, partial [Pseudomonadales bacterium]
MVVSFIGAHLDFGAWLMIPVLGALAFAIAMISVYGFRSSLISLCGLLALVLSFSHDPEELAIWQFALLIGVGGLWYLLLATILYRINPRAQTEEFLYKAYMLTADFLETRRQLVGEQANRKVLQAQLFTQQSELMELHTALREILIRKRKNSGRSIYNGKRLLVFTQLVEILETAVAHPVQYDKMDELFKTHPEFVKDFQTLIYEMSHQLRMIATAGSDDAQLPGNDKLNDYFQQLSADISTFGSEGTNTEGYLMLQNLLEYQESQFKKIKKIKWLLGNPDADAIEFMPGNVARRFIVRQDYDPRLLLCNLSFRSSIFKHSLRLSVTL